MKLILIMTLLTASFSIFAECAATQSTQERMEGKSKIEIADETKSESEAVTTVSQ